MKQTCHFSLFAHQKANHAKHDRWSKKQNLVCSDNILIGITLYGKTALKQKKGRTSRLQLRIVNSPIALHLGSL